MKSLVHTVVLIAVIGCTSNNSSDTSDQKLLDLHHAPEYVRELDSLSIFPPDASPLSNVSYEEEQRFGEIYPALLSPSPGFGPVTAVDSDGNVYLADRGERTIPVYRPDGSLLKTVGGEGRGPGEFEHVTAIGIHRERLIAYDSNLMRIQVYDCNPIKLSKTIVLDSQPWSKFDEVRMPRPSTVFGLRDSTFLAGVLLNDRDGRSHYGYYTLDWDGNIISDKIVEQQRLLTHQGTLNNGGITTLRLPFTSKGVVAVAADGTIYHVNTREFLIRVYNSEGSYLRAIYYPYDKDSLEKEEAMDLFHPNLRSVIEKAEFPDVWPALETMFVDDKNRIWVATITDDKDAYEWWILENSGKLRAKFTWPRDKPIQVVRDGKMYVRMEDEESGARRVVRYRITMEPRNN